MSGTGWSGAKLPGTDLGGHRRIAFVVAAEVVITWALVALLGWIGLVGLIGAVVAMWLESFVGGEAARQEQRVIRTALRAHADPGPQFRAAVDGAATRRLAASAVDRWAAPVVCVLVATACVLVAVVRDDVAVALPVLPLLVLGAVADRSRRREEALAERWISAPPVPAEDEEAS